MIDSEAYLRTLIALLKETFGKNLIYVGLQGGYRRGEATEKSDVDIMAVLDHLSVADLAAYREALEKMPFDVQSCGFICGREELIGWNKSEICQLIHETRDVFGCLGELCPTYTLSDVSTHVKTLTGNLYHEICHRYIYSGKEKSAAHLADAYRQTFYILQNLCYLERGEYPLTRKALLCTLSDLNRKTLEIEGALRRGETVDFDAAFENLFAFCQSILKRTGND